MMRARSAILLVAAVFLLACAAQSFAATGPADRKVPLRLRKFSYVEDFEEKDPVRPWASNGECKVNFKGITNEKALTGKKSFKLDITIKSGSYHYWSVPAKVPCEGELKFSGNIFVAECKGASVGLGLDYRFPPSVHSGCGTIATINKPTQIWTRQEEAEVVKRGIASAAGVVPRCVAGATGENVGPYVSCWGIFIYGREGSRIVIYVDDVRIEGEAPEVKAYDAQLKERWRPYTERFQKLLAEWRTKIRASEREAAKIGRTTVGKGHLKKTITTSLSGAAKTLAKLQKQGWASPGDVAAIKRRIGYASSVVAIAKHVADRGPETRCLIHVAPAITNAKILPNQFPVRAPLSTDVRVTACPGEYESASFVVYALRGLNDLTVEVGALSAGAETLPADALDVRVVKCWFQGGAGTIVFQNKRVLVPELLLKDDDLVRADLEKKENLLRQVDKVGKTTYVNISTPTSEHLADIRPRDADRLLPVTIPAESAKQFWLTVHVPSDARPGKYVGRIRLRSAEGELPAVNLSVRVLPFELLPPKLVYSIYYRARLAADGKGSISSERKSPEQYLAEMRNLKAHGVLYPTVYQGYNEQLLTQVCELREKAGLPKGLFFGLGRGTGSPKNQAQLNALASAVRRWRSFLAPFGYDQVYFYGIDEATGEALQAQRAAWRAVQEAGGRTFVACYRGTFERMGSLLNLAVFSGGLDAKEARKFHSVGSQIFSYGNPQVGVEEPETYRRNFGLRLWKSGFDGAMDYAYQHGFNHVWNDFDNKAYRDHNFTYPTVNGVIDTIEWEGFREGVDDVRYVTTLLKAIEKAKANKASRQLAEEAENWVKTMAVAGDLDALRAKMVEWILRLRGET